MGTEKKKKNEVNFFMVSFKISTLWFFFEFFKSLSHALAVLGYLPKLRWVMGLVFSADFLHTFSIKMFLFKYPTK